MTTISKYALNETTMAMDDLVEYLAKDFSESGELIAGETIFKIINAYSEARLAQFAGDVV